MRSDLAEKLKGTTYGTLAGAGLTLFLAETMGFLNQNTYRFYEYKHHPIAQWNNLLPYAQEYGPWLIGAGVLTGITFDAYRAFKRE